MLEAASAEIRGTGKVVEAIRIGARKLRVKLSKDDLERLAEFSLAEWWGPPPNMESMRDLISAYLSYVGRVEEAKKVQRSDSCRGRMLKRLEGYFDSRDASTPRIVRKMKKPKKGKKDEPKPIQIPYEELRCPQCKGFVMIGDLPAIDHYLEHFKELKLGGKVIRDLADYRSLPDEEKLKAYQIARRFFKKKR
ncbi:MAG: hypothetical protein DRG31_07930 [Deltaproteobacteria bacterium]|nr:MAG: hypothetical protein DRG31_07930 [Deltaproteobacteria bacterium]